MQAVKRGLLIQCVSEALVLCRGENDSFVSNGILRRIFIDFDGYIRIAHQVFPEDKEVQAALIGVLKREHPFRRLIKIEVLKHKDYKQYEQLRQHLRVVGWREIDFLCARCLQGLYSMYSLLKKRK
jgi:abequosyltransferase